MLRCLLILCSVIFATEQLQNTRPENPKDKPIQKCITDSDVEGVCVVYYLCSDNQTVITDGAGILDPRIKERTCTSYLDVCCQYSEVRENNNPITQRPVRAEGCGWRNVNGISAQLEPSSKSTYAEFAEFPWVVAILKEESGEPSKPLVYRGAGSLIHPSVVLTAAHNVDTNDKFKVRAGEWDTTTTQEIYPHQDRDVVEVVKHKDYNKRVLFYDIALLFLSTPMSLAPNVGLICLPTQEQETYSGTKCYTGGWGKDRFGVQGHYQTIMKKVDLPTIDRKVCQKQLRKTRLGDLFELHPSFMCAGGEDNKDACKGDGGSPLVCPIEGETERYYQSGIVAWGIGCGQEGVPAVYVDVAKLREWIDDKIIGHVYDTSLYTY